MKQKFAQAVRILTTPPVFSALMCTLLYVLVPGSFASLGHYLLAIVCLSLLPVLAYGALALMMSAVTRKSGASIAVTLLLGVLALCAYPFLQLGIQYLLYKLTAFLASVIGDTELCGLIGGLGGAFGLILGMVGSCARVLLVSILASAAVVTS